MIRSGACFFTAITVLGLASCTEPASVRTAPSLTAQRTAPQVTQRLQPAATKPEVKASSQGKVTRMPLGNFFEAQQSGHALIFDVRPEFIYRLGHVPNAVSWPKGQFEAKLAIHEPEIIAARMAGRPVVLYCTDLACPDSRTMATRLAARGHSVSILEGGWDAWKTGDLPVE
jgi:rhodanese-related sulfurtransferase